MDEAKLIKGMTVYRADYFTVAGDPAADPRLAVHEFVVTTRGEFMAGVTERTAKGVLLPRINEFRSRVSEILRRYSATREEALAVLARALERDVAQHTRRLKRDSGRLAEVRNALGLGLLLALMLGASACRPTGFHVADEATSEPWASWDRDAFRERVIADATIAAERWGADFGALDGVTVAFVDYIDLTGFGQKWGATDLSNYAIYLRVRGVCPEATALAHEVGHVVLDGDLGHTDPRWSDPAFWRGMADALKGAVPPGETDCLDAIDFWVARTGG